ncbi:DUF1540 domain-containing protein [Proteobacteria bacterium 005FR1]|nr:DUF1540 domain-containing protein [Proteobacteria bacterium 005FR1]
MKLIAVEMPEVKSCVATSCVYNIDESCNARAITVGDGSEADCDTYYHGSSHTNKHYEAGVGACKVSSCRYNDDWECQADAISVGAMQQSAVCETFEARA